MTKRFTILMSLASFCMAALALFYALKPNNIDPECQAWAWSVAWLGVGIAWGITAIRSCRR